MEALLRAIAQVTYNPRMPQSEIIFSVRESPEGGYEARALGHSIFTEADSFEELKAMIRDAVSCHFERSQHFSIAALFNPN
jgi:hypothetical protein